MQPQSCGAPAPANSATCYDLRNNIDFSLYRGGQCSDFARFYVKVGIDAPLLTLRGRGHRLRVGLKIAQGHKQEVFDSFDYIGDKLLLTMTKSLFDTDGARKLVAEFPKREDANQFQCPGWAKILAQSGLL